MSGNTDFLALYQELGLSADCSLQDFKLAYRKRVGEIHPDRGPRSGATMQGLQRLNGQYSSAMEFHRRHGRLPGAAQPFVPPRAQAAPTTNAHGADAHAAVPAHARSRGGYRAVIALLAILAAVAMWAWTDTRHEPAIDAAAPTIVGTTSARTPSARVAPAQAIELGSPADRVRAILGEPVSGWEQRWEYGPSWIAFRCGLVSDWYSSPLRPLKVTSARPPEAAAWSLPKNCKE